MGVGKDSCKNGPFAAEEYKCLSELLISRVYYRFC